MGWKAIVVKEGGIRKDDQDRYLEDGLKNIVKCGFNCSIWLVDHAWTFRPSDAGADLRRYQGLMGRFVSSIFSCGKSKFQTHFVNPRLKALFDMDESSTEEDVSREKWKFANVYSVRAGMSGGTGDVRLFF